MRFSARILSVVFGFIFFLLLLPPQGALAQSTPYQPALNANLEADVPRNMHTLTQTVFIDVLSTSLCYLAGVDPVSPDKKCLGFNPETGKIGYVEGGGGAIGATLGLISYTFTPPASSGQFINYLARNFGVTQKAYAADCREPGNALQGYGFCSISPLTQTWTAMRDIVYLLLVIIFVVIGVAIMLRVHIDPRTVMTIENQIPKIIIAILLVTFSLAISGFLIDIMYVSIFLIGNVIGGLATEGGIIANADFSYVVKSATPPDALGSIAPFSLITSYITAGMVTVLGIDPSTFTNDVFGIINHPIEWLVMAIVWIVVIIALWIALIRVWIALIVAYVSILLDIVFAPFWFLAGLVPGGSIGTSGWFKDILANLAVFPAVISMFYLGIIFSGLTSQQGSDSTSFFAPPMVAPVGNSAYLGGIIMFGFIFMTPHVIGIIKSAIKAPKLNLGPVFEPVGGAASTIKHTFGGASKTTRAAIFDPYHDQGGKARLGRILQSLG